MSTDSESSGGSFTENFLQSILSNIDSRDPVVANAWLDTLLDVIDLLPVEVLGKEVLSIAVSKAGDGQPTFSRLGSCQLVGKLGLKLDQQAIHNELIPLARSLSHDSEWTVRASMCSQLLSITKGLTKNGEDHSAKEPVDTVISVLFELGDDEVESVRLVVVETISSMLQYLEPGLVKCLMVPWIQKISQQAFKVEDKILPLLAQHWARISRTVQPHLTEQEKDWFIEFYYSLASLGSNNHVVGKANMPDVVADTDNGQKLEIYAEVRHACAVNSSALIPFIGPELFSQRVSTSLRALSVDPYFVVRRAVAGNLLDLCKSLGKVIHPLLNQLLADPCIDVTSALVPQIGAIIEHLARLGPLGPYVDESVVVETCGAVLRCEEQVMSSSSWRMQSDMLSQLAVLPLCLPCNPVHDMLVPRLWHRIETMRPLPCRVAAAQTLMLCVRSERRAPERAALVASIVSKLASSRSCHGRMLFLRVSPVLFDLLSRRFIRKEFFLPILRLAGDKVANVRLRFASLLPKLHLSLRGLDPVFEKQLIVELDSSIRSLVESEKDRDVKDELENFFRWIREQERISRSDPEHAKRLQEEEEADRRKEEEEKSVMMIDMEPATTLPEGSGLISFLPEPVPAQPNPVIPSLSMITPERPATPDPSTDEFFRDAGVRLTSPKPPPRNQSSVVATESRIPSIQGASRLEQPSASTAVIKTTTPTSTALPHFGIARGVQQIQPQPSMAYGVTVAPPMRIQRRIPPSLSTSAAKSRSQENLVVPPPRPRAARPISTCFGTNDLLQAGVTSSKVATTGTSSFNRSRFRASIGSPSSIKASSTPPIPTLPINTPPKWAASTNRTSPGPTAATKPGSAGTGGGGGVKLSDMKNALPITPVPPRKPDQLIRGSRKLQSSTVVDQVAVQLMETLDLGGASVTRLRKPASSASLKSLSTPNSADSSPSSLQRRNPWRRSLNFNIASSSPPPPPPRKSFATLPRTPNHNNNNNSSSSTATTTTASSGTTNNNNNNNNNTSKLPVPAFKRPNSYLGSNC